MATVWKKVLMEGSAIDINDIVGVTTMEKGQILRGDANGDVENIDVASGNIIYGGSANDALLCSFGTLSAGQGLVSPSLTGEDGSAMTGTVTFSVADAAIGTAKIQDSAVTLGKIANQSHGIMVYHQTDGVPTFLAATSAGDVLKVSDTGVGFTFGAPEATSLIDISDADTAPADTTERRILFGGTTADGLQESQTVYGDTEFTYKNQTTITTTAWQDWGGNYDINNLSQTANSTGALKTPDNAGIIGTLVGTARGAMYPHISALPAVSADDVFYNLPFYKSAGITGASSFSKLAGHDGLSYNPKEKTLKVTNLIVDGTQTTINSTNVQVEDKTIRLGVGATESTIISSSTASGTGIVVNIGRAGFDVGDEDGVTADNLEGDLPRVVWENGSGTQASTNSVLGWKAAYKGSGTDTALASSTTYGIGVMHVADGTVTEVLGADLNNSTLSIGIGAMALVDYDGEPALYIQTAL